MIRWLSYNKTRLSGWNGSTTHSRTHTRTHTLYTHRVLYYYSLPECYILINAHTHTTKLTCQTCNIYDTHTYTHTQWHTHHQSPHTRTTHTHATIAHTYSHTHTNTHTHTHTHIMATSPKHAALDHAALDADVLAELKQAMTKNISKVMCVLCVCGGGEGIVCVCVGVCWYL